MVVSGKKLDFRKKTGFLELGPRFPRGKKKVVDIRNGRWDNWL